MSTKILVSLGLLLTIMINTAFATPCVLLGSNPSFIVKFKDRRSNPFAKNLLSSQLLANLSKKTGIKFTSSKIMSQGAYILHFNPTHSKLLKHSAINNEGCFSRQTIDKIVEKLKKLPNVTLVEPNYLSVIEPNVEPPYPASTVSITPDQWDLKMIKVLDAWKITEGKPSVRAAVLDSGIVSNANLSPNLVSDAHGGVSFVENGETKVGATPSCTTECGNQYKHGTWVAGNIVSSGKGCLW